MTKKQRFKVFKRKPKVFSEDDEISNLEKLYDEIDRDAIQKFRDLPLSEKTQKGLQKHNFVTPTEIQRDSIMYSLRGEDVLGAAKTGSGKTLAFLIPVLEKLYRSKWTRYDGVGALVITPTRELAYQIFETLKKLGEFHDFSAGLIIGGKDLKFEKKRMDQCNIVICTPGRLLQHMDENPIFDCSTMQILVLDEADRCLDMGFEKTMNSIIDNLPPERQTLLFSATQTKSVKDLARLSLTNPRYISVHEDAKFSTPSGLVQSYIKCELSDKMNFLWSFIKNHKSQKILIFLSSCKQVKYTYEVFCRLRPGVSLLALYGTLHQSRRMAIYDSFCQKQHVVLFATDIAARGLDFPAVNWVVQLDCPESANEYIHRAGRTARYQRAGESLLVLLPSELKMLEQLEQKKIPIDEIQVNMQKLHSIQRNLEALLARDNNLKESAQRAFVAYIKSVFLMKDKEVFNVAALDTDAYSKSLGLAISPRIRFLQKRQKMMADKAKKDQEDEQQMIDKMNSDNASENDDVACEDHREESRPSHSEEPRPKYKNFQKVVPFTFYDDKEDDDDFIVLKRKDHELDIEPITSEELVTSKKSKKPISRAALAKKMLKKNILPNKKVVFDEGGEVVLKKGKEYISELARQYEKSNEAGIDITTAQQVLREEDKYDKEIFREKIKQKHKEERLRQKEERRRKPVPEEAESGSEDDYEPDVSWLPDFDKIRKNQNDSEDESEANESNSQESETDFVKDTKKKRKQKRSKSKKESSKKIKLQNESEDEDYIDTGLTLAEDEEIALRMMNSNE